MPAMATSVKMLSSLAPDGDIACGDVEVELEQEGLVKTRAYQLEMFEKSVGRNVIITVSPFCKIFLHRLTGCRWKLAVGKHGCKL
jgi:hypothetical protein